MQNLRTSIHNKPFSHFGAFLNKCTKGKKLHLKSDAITYLFAFNGKEEIDEINGGGNDLDFGARIYDAKLGRFFSIDPLSRKFLNESNFSYAGCSPIAMIDVEGGKKKYYIITINEDGSRSTQIVIEKYTVIKTELVVPYEFFLGDNNPEFTEETRNFDVAQIIVRDLRNNTVTVYKEFKTIERSESKILNDFEDDYEEWKSSKSGGGVMWYSKKGKGQETREGKYARMEDIDLLLNVVNIASAAAADKSGEIVFKFFKDSKTTLEQMKVVIDGCDITEKVIGTNPLENICEKIRGHTWDSCVNCNGVDKCGMIDHGFKVVPAKGKYNENK